MVMQRIALAVACLACGGSQFAESRRPIKGGVNSLERFLLGFSVRPVFNPSALTAGTSGTDVSSMKTQRRHCTVLMDDLPTASTTVQELEMLSLALEFAVRTEDYERAARLQDRKNALEEANPGLAVRWYQQIQVRTMLKQALFSDEPIEARETAVQSLKKKASPPNSDAEAEDALHKLLREVDGPDEDQMSEIVTAALTDFWLQSGDDKVDDLMCMGVQLMEGSYWKEAEEVFTKVIRRKPGFAEAWNKRATVYFAMKDYKKAIADYQKVLSIKPRHFGCLSGLAMCHFSLYPPDADAGLKCCEKALDVHPRLSNLKLVLEKLKLTNS